MVGVGGHAFVTVSYGGGGGGVIMWFLRLMGVANKTYIWAKFDLTP